MAIGNFLLARPDPQSDYSDKMDADLLRERIRQRLEATGKKPVPVAVAIGKGRDYLRDFLSGQKNSLATDAVLRIAVELECSADYFMDPGVTDPGPAPERMVRIIGIIGADSGGEIIYVHGQESGDVAPIAPGGTSESVALEVKGHSMRGIADDGALIYFENQHNPPTPDMISYVCIVETEDGRVLFKRLLKGSGPGLYDLESINGPTISDVRLRWAAEPTAIIPAKHARRVIRRAGERQVA